MRDLPLRKPSYECPHLAKGTWATSACAYRQYAYMEHNFASFAAAGNKDPTLISSLL